ncbi:MAG TPA: TonB-dependent receptor [Myxococcales bacterium]|jgi:outer membrane receptor protein involved in Fe transport
MIFGLRAPPAGRALALVAASLLSAASARAQTAPAAAPEDRPLDTVDSQGQPEPAAPEAPVESKDPTSFATSLPRRPAEQSRTADLVQSAPGAVVRDMGLNQPATVSLRGSTSDQVAVLLDGVPLNPAAGGGADLSLVPVAFVDRVSVIRGAVGARYGGGAVGGAVSLSTKAPAKAGEREWYGELSYGSFSTFSGSTGVSFAPGEHTSALVTAFGGGSEGDFGYPVALRPTFAPDDKTWYARENNQARRGGALARLAYEGAVEASALIEVDGGDRGLPGTAQQPSTIDHQEDVRGLGVGRLAFFVPWGLRVETRLIGRLGRLRVWNPFSDGSPQDEAHVFGEVSVSKLWGRNAIEVGLTGGRESLSSSFHGSRDRGSFGAYVCDEITFSFLTVIPAFRYERVGGQDGFSPKLGLGVPAGEHVSIKANAGRSFRAPSFGELYLQQGTLFADPTLKPETGLYVDLGPELRWGPLTASIAGYWGQYENLIVYERGAHLARPVNLGLGHAEVWGGEAEALFQKGPVFASAAYTLGFSVHRVHEPSRPEFALYDGKELPYHPRHRLHARLGLEWWRLEAHGEVDVQSEQFLNRTNQDQLAGHARLDVGASVVLDRDVGLSLHAELKNLFDSYDQDLYGYPLPGRAFYLALRFDSLQRSNP